ncbi:MAG: di-heme oxidoredictase family protein, partial [Bacteroidota bacterium]
MNIILKFSLLLLTLMAFVACEEDEHLGGDVDLSIEEMSGGANFTTFDFGQNAFGGQGNALSRQESRLFVAGNALFRSNWIAAPASVASLDGLGPLFNAISCGSCHFKDGRAAPPDEMNRAGLLWRISIDGTTPEGAPMPHAIYGNQLQDRALPKASPEADIMTTYQEITGQYPDGTTYTLQKPIYTVENFAYGAIEGHYNLSPRIATHIAGLGLLESITNADILANEDIDDTNGDGISGKANYVWNVQTQSHTLGRFGWKANQPSILQQNAAAFNGDMGLTSNLFPEDEFTNEQQAQHPDIANGGAPEVSDEQLFRISLYIQSLAVPAKRNIDTEAYLSGRSSFMKVG